MRNGSLSGLVLFIAVCMTFFTACETGGPMWPSFSVVYHPNYGTGTMANSVHRIGIAQTLSPNAFTRTGYSFMGWARSPGNSEMEFGDKAEVINLARSNREIVTLYAVWTHNFTVVFDANGGGGAAPVSRSVAVGSGITIPDGAGLSKSGYVFGGWNTRFDGAGSNFLAGDWFAPTGNTTLYAVWVRYFIVTFDANSGTGMPPESLTVAPGSSSLLPASGGLSKAGHDFGGWNTRPDGTGDSFEVGANFTPTGNITLYARWLDSASVPGTTLAEQLPWLRANAQSGGRYLVEVSFNETITSALAVLPIGRNNVTITIRGIGSLRTVSLGANGSLFVVGSGVTLVLCANIALQGRPANNRPLVEVNSGGALVMNEGALITGNNNASAASADAGGSVRVNNGGIFTMYGGTISGSGTASDGGGVRLMAGSTFSMHGGAISGNTAQWGGGVFVGNGSAFNMRGGTIFGNRSVSDGGGVLNWGTFRISGGIIHGNAAPTDVRNTAGGTGAALSQRGGTALLGTFNVAGDFSTRGLLSTSETTIHVLDGDLQP